MAHKVSHLEQLMSHPKPLYSEVLSAPPPSSSLSQPTLVRAPIQLPTSKAPGQLPPDPTALMKDPQLRARVQLKDPLQTTPLSRSESLASLRSGGEFQFPKGRRYRKKQPPTRGQQETDAAKKFRGAPLPKRFIFLARVEKECEIADIHCHIEEVNAELNLNLNLKDIQIKCVSHPDAKYNSFCIECSVKDFSVLMKGNVWPNNVYVSKFHFPRNGSDNKQKS
jgi:hypothetical protein